MCVCVYLRCWFPKLSRGPPQRFLLFFRRGMYLEPGWHPDWRENWGKTKKTHLRCRLFRHRRRHLPLGGPEAPQEEGGGGRANPPGGHHRFRGLHPRGGGEVHPQRCGGEMPTTLRPNTFMFILSFFSKAHGLLWMVFPPCLQVSVLLVENSSINFFPAFFASFHSPPQGVL